MRTLHVVSLPHTTLTQQDSSCAYSMKVLKFVPMMQAQGHRVVLYGPDAIACAPDEHVVITTQADRERWGFGGGFDTARSSFSWDSAAPHWRQANSRAIEEIRKRIEPRDYLCIIAGWAQKPIADAIAGASYTSPITVEWGVGYQGWFSSFCAFESYAWMHYTYALEQHKVISGRAFDTVIPNFFDASQFHDPARWLGAPKADYLLYVGRVTARKGPHVAMDIANRVGMPLVVAGPGATSVGPGVVKFDDDSMAMHGDVTYVGEVRFEERANLMARAAAVIVPTLYIEPFGGVAVEAMLSGTPVVASDWGSFTELVTPEVGQRFRTLREGAQAVLDVQRLDPQRIREQAFNRFSLEAVGPKFTRWFLQLETLWGRGWYT